MAMDSTNIIKNKFALCRTCMKENANIQIFNNNIIYGDIIYGIKAIANLEVNENDGLSKFICSVCVSTLQRSMEFRITAQESDAVQREQSVKLETTLDIEFMNEDSVPDNEESENLIKIEIDPPKNNIIKSELDSTPSQNDKSTEPKISKKNNFKMYRPKTKRLKCEVCKKEVTKYYYQQHLALHGQGTPKIKEKVECSICKKHLEKSYLKQHLSSVHNDKKSKYICDICGKTYGFRSGYNNHILSHTNEFPYKCDQCPYKGRHLELLKTHKRTHTRDYKYKCTECSSSFLTSGNLNKHKLKHRERTFQCVQCPRMFHLKGELDKHVLVEHMGVKNHVCEICHKAFGYRSTMMKHQYLMHDREKNVSGRVPSYLEIERKKEKIVKQNTLVSN